VADLSDRAAVSTLQLHHTRNVSEEPAANGRIAGLDALRAVLALLVVLLHASMPYMLAPFPGLPWPVHDAPSAWVDAVGWWADSFVMPTFLLLAGFSAWQLMHHKGPQKFLSHRVRRVLVPLALGAAVLLPIELYLWIAGWVGQGQVPAGKLLSLKLDPPHGDHLWGLSHLWFLQYLFLYSLVAWWMASRTAKHRSLRIVERESDSSAPASRRSSALFMWSIALLGGLSAGGIMCLWPRVLIGFHHGWWPHPANFLCFGLLFAAGWQLAARHRAGGNISAGCELSAGAGLLLFAISLPGLREFAALRDAYALADWMTAVTFGMSGWLSAIGWTGVFLKYANRGQHRAVRYLAEASFWLYLIHHPLVALLHIDLALVNWPSEIKFALASSAAVVVSLGMYESFVRHTQLGVLLNGRRADSTRSDERPLVAEPTRRAA
jgi:peptidoglycan/LPS O-acetylase OafA/YrhL